MIDRTNEKQPHLSEPLQLTLFESELGKMIACADSRGLCLLEFTEKEVDEKLLIDLKRRLKRSITLEENDYFSPLKEQLTAYFSGQRKTFDLPLVPEGTPFQKQVWQTLLTIPYGTTISYSKQAALMERASAVRAVANGNRTNKLAIIIPCHRVIGADGSLTGYAGSLWRKKRLLELEARHR